MTKKPTKPKKPLKDLLKQGRPTKYHKDLDEIVFRLGLVGLTEQEMCSVIGVETRNFNKWKLQHESFRHALKEGKESADAQVARALFHRATGYSHEDVDIRVVDGKIVKTPIIKHYAPDTVAAIFWLKNRQKEKWRDKVEHGLTDQGGNDVVIFKLPDNGR